MIPDPVIVFLGASVNWVPRLLKDLLSVFPQPVEVRFVDIDPVPAERCRQWGEAANRVFGRNDLYRAATNRPIALSGADAVLITLSTGGLSAMAKDLAIPEKYGIFATVGDTCGPAGWSRSIRNIPVFRDFATDFDRVCPGALIVNYSNPMASLTATLQTCCHNPVIGLCHAYFETKDVIQALFGLPDWNSLKVEISGVNHFTWVTDFTVAGADGYPPLHKMTAGRSLEAVLPDVTADELGFASGHRLCAALYDHFGCLTYPADRHTCEFLSHVVCNFPARSAAIRGGLSFETLTEYRIQRTTIAHREAYQKRSLEHFGTIFTQGPTETIDRSRETGADMIRAYLGGRPVTDAVNQINTGQAPDLPIGACVETLGTVRAGSVRPLIARPLPPAVSELVRPAALSQKWLVDGILEGKKDLVMASLLNDPQCRGLTPARAVELGRELLPE